VGNQLRLRNRRYSFLETEQNLFVEKLSKTLRQHHTSFTASNKMKINTENPTAVEWIDYMWVRGQQIKS
jgi:hypothetical protein